MMKNWILIGKKICPFFLLPYVYSWRGRIRGVRDSKKIKEIKSFYLNHTPNKEILEILQYLPKCGLIPFPYQWTNMGYASSVMVYYDRDYNLYYTLLQDKKMYYPRDMTINDIQVSFYFVQEIEQHVSSPHRYLTSDFNISADDIVVDCGVAEGNFSLAIVEQVKKIYLFEPEEQWMEPLKATFEPWKDKIIIVQKFISDVSDENTVTLDEYFAGKEGPTFCKMDVEGYEERVLNGAKHMLSSGNLKKIVTCTYHYADAEEKLGNILRSYDYRTTPSSGYMLFSMYDELKPPYFRRGLLRCVKQ